MSKPTLRLLEDPDKVLDLDEAFRELKDNSAWHQIQAILDGEWERAVRAGLLDYRDPYEVAFRAGYVSATEMYRDLPAEVARRAQAIKDGKKLDEEIKEGLAAERRIPRHTVSG